MIKTHSNYIDNKIFIEIDKKEIKKAFKSVENYIAFRNRLLNALDVHMSIFNEKQ